MKISEVIFLLRTFALLITFNMDLSFFPLQIFAQQTEVDYQEFYNQLLPFGQWIESPNYGYVWIPAGIDFIPHLTKSIMPTQSNYQT